MTPADPVQPRSETEADESSPRTSRKAPLSFVPHDASGASSAEPVRIRTSRYGELDERELIHLLDSIEDERARSRFRESIYISLFIWIAIAWVVLYGPRYLWHAPKMVTPFEVLKQRELTQLSLPAMHAPPPSVPRPAPKLDNRTLEHLRSMEPPPPRTPPAEMPKIEQPAAPAVTNSAPPVPAPVLPLPSAPQPTRRTTPPVVAEAPTPQPSTRPNFNTDNSAESSIQNAIRNAARHPGSEGYGSSGNGSSPLSFGKGVEILSDTQGVDFNPYIRRILADIYNNWLPLIPEECKPPLSKQGETLVRFSILPDGRIGGMWLDGSTHDDAINRSAWGSITSEGQFPPLPAQFHGPNLELRIHYYVNKEPQ
ncbi:MAG TPA: TonB C-terminal domain-containing protein [Candidatus Aquilonibacter sp.]|nr:TonB C-terminal domain-containing protein [Candidatus Aquilonibacter sp.]